MKQMFTDIELKVLRIMVEKGRNDFIKGLLPNDDMVSVKMILETMGSIERKLR